MLGIPSDGLGIGLGDQIVGLLQRAAVVALQDCCLAVEFILRAVIRVDGSNIEIFRLRTRSLPAAAARQNLRDELVRRACIR